jgi:hypothetical protein
MRHEQEQQISNIQNHQVQTIALAIEDVIPQENVVILQHQVIRGVTIQAISIHSDSDRDSAAIHQTSISHEDPSTLNVERSDVRLSNRWFGDILIDNHIPIHPLIVHLQPIEQPLNDRDLSSHTWHNVLMGMSGF